MDVPEALFAPRGAERATPAAAGRGFPGLRLGLRTKGWIALGALFAYLMLMCLLVVSDMRATLAAQDALADEARVGRALARLEAALAAHGGDAGAPERLPQEARIAGWAAEAEAATSVSSGGPAARLVVGREVADLAGRVRAYHDAPSEAAAADVMARWADALGRVRVAAAESAQALASRTASFQADRLKGAGILVVVGLAGMALLGAAVLAFSTRTVADLTALMRRTSEIVAGRATRPTGLARFDELGQLATAIDELEVALKRRERDLELERREGFHREKMAAIGSLAAGVLTEIGNPIAAIDGFARTMRDAPTSASLPAQHVRAASEAILEQTGRLLVVARQIEEFTAPQPSRRELIDVNAVVEHAVGLLRFDEALRGIEVVLDLDRQLGAIPGTADRLVQVLMNLVGNAADALRERPGGGARLVIRTRRDADDLVLEVADNGAGMSEEVRRRAFEPFFSTKPAGRGTGLGLPLCQSIVDDHGGRIGLVSEAGKGTRVTIRFPVPPGVGGTAQP